VVIFDGVFIDVDDTHHQLNEHSNIIGRSAQPTTHDTEAVHAASSQKGCRE